MLGGIIGKGLDLGVEYAKVRHQFGRPIGSFQAIQHNLAELFVLVESARTTAMLFTLLIAATLFANFVNFTTMPGDLKEWITHLGLSPTMIIAAMMLIYVVLGTVMEELTMVLLTIPLFFPIVTSLGFDPVWFGVLIVMIVQIGLISPPVGMNLFVLNALLPGVGLVASAELSSKCAQAPKRVDDRKRPAEGGTEKKPCPKSSPSIVPLKSMIRRSPSAAGPSFAL